MSIITINKTKIYNKDIPNIKSISFNYLGHKVYSAQKIQKMIGVFISNPVESDSGIVTWKEMICNYEKNNETDVFIYIRSSSALINLNSASWSGPYLNSTNDISEFNGKYLQFMVILINNDKMNVSTTPIFKSIQLSYYTSSSAVRFYSKAFDVGFVPKHILLTYNAEVSPDAIVRFAVSGFDTVDISEYQYIEPNKIEELSELSLLSNKIKLMIEMIGSSSIPITIHEVAFMFSGDQQLFINDMSSSSMSSSSSTEIRSSSSSSSESSSTEIMSSSSYDCPNDIYSFSADIVSNVDVETYGMIATKVNSSINQDNYIILYSGDTTGKSYDSDNIIYGDTSSADNLETKIMLSVIVNSSTYYIKIYGGPNTSQCCSNIHGTEDFGEFVSAGYLVVKINDLYLKYVQLYIKI